MGKKKIEVDYGPRLTLKGLTQNPGKWTNSQNKRYLAFLSQNKYKLQNRNLIRQCRIFKAMADRIQGRTSDQCRGHHRKMLQVYKTIDCILQQLAKNAGKQNKKHMQTKMQNIKIYNSADDWQIQVKFVDNLKQLQQKQKHKQKQKQDKQKLQKKFNKVRLQQSQIIQQTLQDKYKQIKNKKVNITITLNMDKIGEW